MTPTLTPDVWDRTDPTPFITVRYRDDIAGKATRRTVGRVIKVGPVDKWPKLTREQEAVMKLLLPPAIGHAYSIYKYAQLVWVSGRAHPMGRLAERLWPTQFFTLTSDGFPPTETHHDAFLVTSASSG